MVELLVANEKVAGSNLVSRSKFDSVEVALSDFDFFVLICAPCQRAVRWCEYNIRIQYSQDGDS